MKKILPIFAILFALAMTGASPAHAGLLEFFFPSLRVDDSAPTASGHAPFAAPKGEEAAIPAQNIMELDTSSAVPMDKPHRRTSDISEWLVMAVSEAMTFEARRGAGGIEEVKNHFDAGGFDLFQNFLQRESLKKIIDDGRYDVRTVVENMPLLLNEGVVDGRYRWLYQVPVMITFIEPSQNYKGTKPVTQEMQLSVQVGRAKNAGNETAVLIERWDGKVVSKKARR